MRIGIISDNHMGLRQYGRTDRETDFYLSTCYAFDSMLNELEVDVVICAGDLIHQVRPTSQTVAQANSLNAKLRKKDKLMCIISGNHDKDTPPWFSHHGEEHSHIRHIHENVCKVTDSKGTSVNIYGLDYMPAAELLEAMKNIPHGVDILVLHTSIADWTKFQKPGQLTLADLPVPASVKLVVIGDTHVSRHDKLNDAGPVFLSPGSTELYRENEDPSKYWYMMEWNGSSMGELEAIHIRTRPVLHLSAVNQTDVAEVCAAITQTKQDMRMRNYPHNGPLVYLQYDRRVTGLISMIYAMHPPDSFVLRPEPLAITDKNAVGEIRTAPNWQDKTVTEIMLENLQGRTHLTGVATELADREMDTSAALDRYVTSRLGADNATPALA